MAAEVVRANRRATHRDVAELAGVSPSVVSYVINGGPRGTSPETRQRVLDAVETLSYRPSASARGLRLRRTHTIGFVSYDLYPFGTFFGFYTAGIMTGLNAALHEARHFMVPYPQSPDMDLAGLQELLRSDRVDGVVVRLAQEPPLTDAVLDLVSQSGVPCVCIERAGAPRFGFGSVTYDDEAGAFMATSYLAGRGHTRIGHLMGDPRQAAGRDRVAGYRRALGAAGVAADPRLVQGGSWTALTSAEGMRSLLALPERPTAVFAASDELAMMAIGVVRGAGFDVPGDIAVVGFDDAPLAQELLPPLTTIRIPLGEIGRRASGMILQIIEQERAEAIAETVPLELVRRGTA